MGAWIGRAGLSTSLSGLAVYETVRMPVWRLLREAAPTPGNGEQDGWTLQAAGEALSPIRYRARVRHCTNQQLPHSGLAWVHEIQWRRRGAGVHRYLSLGMGRTPYLYLAFSLRGGQVRGTSGAGGAEGHRKGGQPIGPSHPLAACSHHRARCRPATVSLPGFRQRPRPTSIPTKPLVNCHGSGSDVMHPSRTPRA